MSDVFRFAKVKPHLGQVRHKVWRWAIAPTSEQDLVWAARCRDYWTLQQETYGLKLSNFTMAVDFATQTLATYAVVERVLPGRRSIGYTVPRVAAAAHG